MFHWYLPGSSTPVRPAGVSGVSLVSSWFVYSCQTCQSRWCFIGIFLVRLLLSDLPESVVFHWHLPGSSTPVRPARVSGVSLVSSWFVYSCQTCRSQWCFIGIFLVRLLLSDLPESVVFHWYLPGSSTPVRPAGVSGVSLVSSWFVYSCQTCRSQWCFIGIFLVRLLLSDLPESVVFHWYLPGSSTPVRPARVSGVSLVSSWFVYSCQTCRSQWCFIGFFLVRLLLSDLPESVVFHWYLPGSSTPVRPAGVSGVSLVSSWFVYSCQTCQSQ